MNMEMMGMLSQLIKKEKFTNNILFMLKNKTPSIEITALEHNKYLYDLVKLFSATGFNIEIEEPRYIKLTNEQAIKIFLDDISTYSEITSKGDEKINSILSKFIKIKTSTLQNLIFSQDMRQQSITKEELASFDGKDGRPAYVAVDNTIYDVTSSLAWTDGVHYGLTPGKDLSSEFLSCHGMNPEALSKVPIVGELVP
jgi:predicted heme/steroid binding protein